MCSQYYWSCYYYWIDGPLLHRVLSQLCLKLLQS